MAQQGYIAYRGDIQVQGQTRTSLAGMSLALDLAIWSLASETPFPWTCCDVAKFRTSSLALKMPTLMCGACGR